MTDKYDSIESLLQAVKSDQLSISEAKSELSQYDELGFAKIDLHRRKRQGFPEVIFGEGKTEQQLVKIIHSLILHEETILITRVNNEKPILFVKHILNWYIMQQHKSFVHL